MNVLAVNIMNDYTLYIGMACLIIAVSLSYWEQHHVR